MTAGLDVTARIWRIVNVADDDVGGALLSGTVAYDCVYGRFSPSQPSLLLLQQGIETKKMARAMVRPTGMVIYERDEWEITGPPYHPNFGERWRIVSVERPAGLHPDDGRGFQVLTLERIERSRSVQ